MICGTAAYLSLIMSPKIVGGIYYIESIGKLLLKGFITIIAAPPATNVPPITYLNTCYPTVNITCLFPIIHYKEILYFLEH